MLILKPKVNSDVFICRKGYYSINVLLACDADLIITYMLAKFSGSVYDSNVLRKSELSALIEYSPNAPNG